MLRYLRSAVVAGLLLLVLASTASAAPQRAPAFDVRAGTTWTPTASLMTVKAVWRG